MSMAADSNMNFHHRHGGGGGGGVFPPSFYNQHVVSFQSGAVGRSSGMVQGNMGGPSGVILPAECGGFSGGGGGGASTSMMMSSGPGAFPANIMEPLPGLKQDTGLAVDWSFSEQTILNDGLLKVTNEPCMMKYIKIAALLPEKTVRDVALRCRWMAKKESVKRRKLEDNYAGKNIKDRKEKMDSSAKANIHLVPPDNVAVYSFVMRHPNYNNQFPYEVPAIDSATQNLLEENLQILNQISENLSASKLDNIDLFSHSRNNMTTILNRMSEMPGIMSEMPALPVSINEQLMDSVLPSTTQALMFGTINGMDLKQEPRC